MNKRFNTRYVRFTPLTRETIIGPSETRPDESLSIPEILSKYIRGQRIDVSFPGGFDTDEDGSLSFEEEFSPTEPQEQAPAAAPAPAPSAPAEAPQESPENSTK